MASLTDVYDGHLRTVTTSRQVSVGASLFVAGAAMVVGSIVVATTGVGAQLGLERIAARQLAGVLAGLGLPATVLGVFTVLPSGPTTRAAAAIGAGVSVLGVALFWVAYPAHWFGAGDPLATVTVLVYFGGAVTTLGCLFAALATFKTRKNPGGTARMEITEEGRVRFIEKAGLDPRPSPTTGSTPSTGTGSVGLFGKGPDGSVQTQTNRDQPSGPSDEEDDDAEILTSTGRGSRSSSSGAGRSQATSADGGTAMVEGGPASCRDAEVLGEAAARGRPDAYCGNCDHFEYVKVEGSITPYCGLHDDLMDDMDACDQWVGSD